MDNRLKDSFKILIRRMGSRLSIPASSNPIWDKIPFFPFWYWKIPIPDSAPENNYFIWGVGNEVPGEIPAIIWMFWDGPVVSPTVVACLQKIRELCTGFEIRLLNFTTLHLYLPEFPRLGKQLPIAMVTDLIRLMLLEKFGGIWIDASILLIEKLDWCMAKIKEDKSELFAYFTKANTLDKAFPVIENWFLMAPKGSRVIRDWREEYEACITSESPEIFYRDNDLVKNNVMKYLNSYYWNCYVSLQVVIRRRQDYRLSLMAADRDAFLYSLAIKKEWYGNQTAAILLVKKKPKKLPKMVKIVASAREVTDLFIQEGYFRTDSLLGHIVDTKA